MALTKEEQLFVQSVKEKIKKYDIETDIKEAFQNSSGVVAATIYNNNDTEYVDTGVELFLIKNSFAYFLDKYCRVDIPGLGTVAMKPYYFQIEMAKELEKYRKVVVDKTRQCLRSTSYVKIKGKGLISIRDVRAGDMIETLIDGMPTYVPVENFYNQGVKEFMRILVNSGQSIECTPDHKILTKEGWKEAQDLTLNDEIINSVGLGNFGDFELEKDEYASLIGYYLADGKSNQPYFVNTNIDYINEVVDAGKLFENCSPYVYNRETVGSRKQAYEARLVSETKSNKIYRPIREFMEKFGLFVNSTERHLVPELLELNKRQMSILINRLYAGDGWISYKKDSRRPNYIQYEIGFGSPCYDLIKELEYILQTKYGIYGWIQYCPFNGNNFWKFRITQKKSVIKFIEDIGIKGKTDSEEISLSISKENPYNSNQSIGKIRKIERNRETDIVYDITTATGDFLANGLMVHNCGISTVFSLYSLWRANFFPSENIDVISLKQQKAQQFINKMKSTLNNLPEWMKTPIKVNNQQQISFAHSNGSISNIVSEPQSDNAGRSDSLSLLIMDELAFYQSDRMVREIISAATPTLSKTGGRSIYISCVVGDTYINTENGIQQVIDFKPKNCNLGFNKIDEFKIDGIKHQQITNTFYDSGITPTRKITFGSGNTNEISEIHPFYIIDRASFFPYWKQTKDIEIGDYALASLREKTFGNRDEVGFNNYIKNCSYRMNNWNGKIDEEISYFLGLLIGDGFVSKKGQYCTITSADEEVQNFLLNNSHFNFKREDRKDDDIHFRLQGKYVIKFLEELGFEFGKKAKEKAIPNRLMQMSKENISALLRGLFDADGHSRTRDGSVGFTSTSKELINQVRLLLDLFGIQVSDERWNVINPEKSTRVNVESFVGQITLSRFFSKKFYEEIGFVISRKQEKYDMVKHIKYPNNQVYPEMNKWIASSLFKKNNIWNEEISRILRTKEKNHISRKHIGKLLNIAELENLSETDEFKKLKDFYDKDWFLLKVKSIEKSEAHTYDFVIPETRSFYINGVIGSNTPNGTSGAGSYYYSQVQEAKQELSADTKYLEIDWWEVPDDSRIKGPKKGYNKVLKEAISRNYYYNRNTKEYYKKFFEPIAKDHDKNPWLKAAFADLKDAKYRQEILHEFIIDGDRVFGPDVMKRIKLGLKDPLFKDEIRVDGHFLREQRGFWIWEEPKPTDMFILAADVASGTSNDFSSIQVLNTVTMHQAAEFKGFISTPMFAKLIKDIAKIYNNAYVVIECNSIGDTIFTNVYNSDVDPYGNVFKQKKTKNGVTRYTGWITDSASRKLMVQAVIDWFSVPELAEKFKVFSERLYAELETWIWVGNDKAMHADNCLPGNTIITCKEGFKKIKDVRVGDLVLTETGEFQPVENIFITTDVSRKRVKEVSASGMPKIKITDGQRILTYKDKSYQYLPVYDIKKGQSVYSIFSSETTNKKQLVLSRIYNQMRSGTFKPTEAELYTHPILQLELVRYMVRRKKFKKYKKFLDFRPKNFHGLYYMAHILFRNNVLFSMNNGKIRISLDEVYRICPDFYNKKDLKYSEPRKYYGNKLTSKIQSIRDSKEEGLLYDLDVAGTHNFVANGYIVHNCHDDAIMAMSLCLHLRDKAQVQESSMFLAEDGSVISYDRNLSLKQAEIDGVSFSSVDGYGKNKLSIRNSNPAGFVSNTEEFEKSSLERKMKEQYNIDSVDDLRWLLS